MRCLIGTAASTGHHASIRSSGLLVSRWAATALPGSCVVQRSRPRPDAGSDLVATTAGRPLGSRRTCCCRSSAQQPPTAAGTVTSPTSEPQQAGDTWRSGSIYTAAAWSAGPSAPRWRPRWCWRPSTGPSVTARWNPINS